VRIRIEVFVHSSTLLREYVLRIMTYVREDTPCIMTYMYIPNMITRCALHETYLHRDSSTCRYIKIVVHCVVTIGQTTLIERDIYIEILRNTCT